MASCSGCRQSSNSVSLWVQTMAAISEPALEPEMIFGSKCSSNSAFSTPIWKYPSIPAPLSISAEQPKQWLARRKKSWRSSNGITWSSRLSMTSSDRQTSSMYWWIRCLVPMCARL
ncbi:hypothetical protein D3C80_1810190 [compost metagenome]